MRKAAVVLAAVIVLVGVAAWGADPPKCQAEKNAMDRAQAACTQAWADWQRAFENEKSADARAEALRPREEAARRALDDATASFNQARAAADRCHQNNGYTAQCSSEEHAQAAASDRVARARAAYQTAAWDYIHAMEASIRAQEQEKAAYDRANAAEDTLKAAVEAYNRCLRGKPRAV